MKYLRYFIYFFSTLTIYIFISQIFDFMNHLGTGLIQIYIGEAVQSTFWLSHPHRAMGTFREPVFLVSFFFPISYFIFILFKRKIFN